jgi:hypothetical protein
LFGHFERTEGTTESHIITTTPLCIYRARKIRGVKDIYVSTVEFHYRIFLPESFRDKG